MMAEKGLLNSRVKKDYYDIWMLSQTVTFDGTGLRDSIRATFDQRGTDVPFQRPSVLSAETPASNPRRHNGRPSCGEWKRRRWVPTELSDVVDTISDFIMPASAAAAAAAEPSTGRGLREGLVMMMKLIHSGCHAWPEDLEAVQNVLAGDQGGDRAFGYGVGERAVADEIP